ncbi:hypothetical protein A2130_00785 [Candidatus Woesebacteria bacterium GWC2_33_12]|uniref:LytR/CpsA/Psr regulator C-terminal domain-containing protein n=1 Tax=Candidatus Woesebacteria bacterium GW2011_GWB1_33_22 TaxID=1618566 RepID=A0A0G0C290_9BACT|nr:MAG: hypothetical protein UR29_C0002G0050 [Candidatus Woesebacteria bacterium GW2011_GWC2_33_12]KKP42522.1 MAG: hypothetical protein UR33_C0002G0098 [Candidatus Woesebacteria bacterium GW2011_GWA2_33_20]KKP45265.1 MAG: hypothetical protein UR35_C0002G0098 [Candidatus Woesebacteria bacterium GW2011_GWB1_33_22]KKP47093.1 MAG: hypothetical protein UR37_C0002G0005 [Microgenomates group bacterium GW2011_GWC1_33_28]KKP50935.1 MAG: hypothetical protein UR41_C0002G0099 [Candidatus Woesebacteria bact
MRRSRFLLLIALFFLTFLFFKVKTLDKFTYINNKDGNAEIIVVDPLKDDLIKIFIDKNFNLESSRNFGEYKLASLWILGEKEKYNGKLVTETIVKNFNIPVYLWKDGDSTNLNLYQTIKVFWLFDKKNDYDYSLTSKTVKDSILINFVNPYVAQRMPKVRIENLTGENGVAEDVSKILEIIGFKTADYSKGYDEKLDCEVIGSNKNYNEIVSKIFNCQSFIDLNQTIDLKIRIGKSFSDRF